MREKVLRYILERKLMRAGDRVAVAVSGGADSVALLRVLLELRNQLGVVLSVAHFNHGLRGEASEADEAFVAELARQHNLEFFSGRGEVRERALTRKLSQEAAARELRYRWLASLSESHNLNEVATGHTLDDQAETVLLKFLRGAGTRGLAGIYPVLECSGNMTSGAKARNHPTEPYGTPKGVPLQIRIIRPLLGVRRGEVELYLAALGQDWREDESNLDHRFARNRVRHELLPLLEREYNPNIRQVLSDAAELARAEEEYWQEVVERELHDRIVPAAETEVHRQEQQIPRGLNFTPTSARTAGFGNPGSPARDDNNRRPDGTAKAVPFQSSAAGQRLRLMNFPDLSLALQRRLLRRFVETANFTLDFEHVEKLLHCVVGELPKAELPGGWLAVRQSGCLELLAPQAGPTFSGYQYILPVPGELRIAEIGLTVRCIPVPQEFANEEPPDSLLSAELLDPELVVRNWRPGDRFWPVHSKSEEKLKRLFYEKHIPAAQRRGWPVVIKGDQIVWVRGLPVARAFAWSGSGDAVKIELLVST